LSDGAELLPELSRVAPAVSASDPAAEIIEMAAGATAVAAIDWHIEKRPVVAPPYNAD